MISVILIPVIAGLLVKFINFRSRRLMLIFLELSVILNSLLVFYYIFNGGDSSFYVAQFTGALTMSLKMDGLSKIFSALIAFLWPLATLFSFEYMTKEHNEKTFFMFYTITYGVTLGIALSENILTMYFFYELLTLVTVALVMHTLTREAILAGRKYLYYSLGGAAFAFIGMVFITLYSHDKGFKLGGMLDLSKVGGNRDVFLIIFLLSFLGFSVKAALWPFNSWLPDAGVAPTPVTALLHAVAVVKAGAFVCIRLTYYIFDINVLRGTWAQYTALTLVCLTIIYGSTMSVKETHLKRRLAYSTMSNLSYILLGVVAMNPIGFVAAFTHMLFHAFMKIDSFFCIGTVMQKGEKTYVDEINGIGKYMPSVMACFTVAALSLTGIPPLAGFVSKWKIAEGLIMEKSPVFYAGVFVLLYSALCTAVYMLTVVVRAWFPPKDGALYEDSGHKPGPRMVLPLVFFSIMVVVFGLYSAPFINWVASFRI